MSQIDNDTPIGDLAKGNSKFLTKADVGREGRILTIRGFKAETIKGMDGQEDQDKTILYFKEEDVKPMVLNKTNAELLQLYTGAQTAGEARGKRIRVFDDPSVVFKGKRTGGLRLGDATERPRRGPDPDERDPEPDPDERDPEPDPQDRHLDDADVPFRMSRG